MLIDTEKFVTGEELLKMLFTDAIRPTERWLYDMRRRRRVPYYKFGSLIFYDPIKVREHWTRTGVIRAA